MLQPAGPTSVVKFEPPETGATGGAQQRADGRAQAAASRADHRVNEAK
jgi:hypothetical protein